MIVHNIHETGDASDEVASYGYATRQVVAVVLTWRRRVGLFKRSGSARHDAGAWHCITGYLDGDTSPIQQAAQELWEETGLSVSDLQQLTAGPTLQLADPRGGQAWTVHTFAATTNRRRLTLNSEHVAYRWVPPARIPRFDGQVQWLADVLRATMPHFVAEPSCSQVTESVNLGNAPAAGVLPGRGLRVLGRSSKAVTGILRGWGRTLCQVAVATVEAPWPPSTSPTPPQQAWMAVAPRERCVLRSGADAERIVADVFPPYHRFHALCRAPPERGGGNDHQRRYPESRHG